MSVTLILFPWRKSFKGTYGLPLASLVLTSSSSLGEDEKGREIILVEPRTFHAVFSFLMCKKGLSARLNSTY